MRAAAACQSTRNVKRLTSRARACVPLRATADPFEGIEKTMLPPRFWRAWGRKRAPHQRPRPHASAAPVRRQWPRRGLQSVGGWPLWEPSAAPGGPRLGGVEGLAKTMLPPKFWRGWGPKRAPHQRPTSPVRAASGPRQWPRRGLHSVGGSLLSEPSAAPGSPRLGGLRIPSKASKKQCSRLGSGGVGAGNEHRTSAPDPAPVRRQCGVSGPVEAFKA